MKGFWDAMAGAGDAQRGVPAERWDIDSVYSPDTAPGKMSVNVRRGAHYPPCAACHGTVHNNNPYQDGGCPVHPRPAASLEAAGSLASMGSLHMHTVLGVLGIRGVQCS